MTSNLDVMDDEFHAAWDELHAATPAGWSPGGNFTPASFAAAMA